MTVTRGYFSVELGSITPLDPALFQQALTLGIGRRSGNDAAQGAVGRGLQLRATDAARVNAHVPTQTQIYRVHPFVLLMLTPLLAQPVPLGTGDVAAMGFTAIGMSTTIVQATKLVHEPHTPATIRR